MRHLAIGRCEGELTMASVTLTIDGRAVTLERGRTVLEAARQLGIAIPTLCHVPGVEPVASCFLCCVQIEGRGRSRPRVRCRRPTAWS